MKIPEIISKIQVRDRDFTPLYLLELANFLTERQVLIIQYRYLGYNNVTTAKKLNICPATVTNELKKIRKNTKLLFWIKQFSFLGRNYVT